MTEVLDVRIMKRTALILVLALCGFQSDDGGNPDVTGLNLTAVTGWKPDWDHKVGTWVVYEYAFAGEVQKKKALLKSIKEDIAYVETSFVDNAIMPVTKSSFYLKYPPRMRGATSSRSAKFKLGLPLTQKLRK